MSNNISILLLGATGYIGGSVLDSLLKHPKASNFDVTVYVRSAEKAKKLEELGLGLKVVTGTLSAVEVAAANSQIVLNCASSDNLPLTEAVLSGAKKYYTANGTVPALIHTVRCVVDSAMGQFASVDIYDDVDNDRLNTFPITQWHRNVDIPIINASKEGYVRSYIVSPGFIFGLATGRFVDAGIIHPVSTVILGNAMATVARGKQGLVGPQKNIWHCVEIHDAVEAYILIFDAVLGGRNIPNGYEGYYFVENGPVVTLDMSKNVATALYNLGRISTLEMGEYTDEELYAADSPLPYFGTNSRIRSTKLRQLGWEPTHTPEEYLNGIQGEIEVMLTQSLSKGFASHR